MSSPTDMLTTAKNIVTAINGLAQNVADLTTSSTNVVTALGTLNTTIAAQTAAFLAINGTAAVNTINTATLVRTGAGRLVIVSITTAGSTNGVIYDSTSTGSPTHPIWAIPNTIGIVHVNIPVTTGIVVVPGTGQVVTVSYS